MAVTRKTCERCLTTFYGDDRFCEDCIGRMRKAKRRARFHRAFQKAVWITIAFAGFLAVFYFLFTSEDVVNDIIWIMGGLLVAAVTDRLLFAWLGNEE
jgi:hypothetical protein